MFDGCHSQVLYVSIKVRYIAGLGHPSFMDSLPMGEMKMEVLQV